MLVCGRSNLTKSKLVYDADGTNAIHEVGKPMDGSHLNTYQSCCSCA